MAALQKVALVTGAGTGIGKAVALALMREGYSVTLAGRRDRAIVATKVWTSVSICEPSTLVRVAVTDSVCVTVSPPRLGDTLTVILEPPDEDVVADEVFE
jgi:NADP-dependent 3-hydroxy acid dehydrogenase YdfG